ncbi:MAG: hypothetical protein GEU93_20115 [Propionibacteriales bacterium]|nr:hypothetical protein [Propionibacteriales bacterium]
MELVAQSGPRHELTETRRFGEPWEGSASLRLRERDQTVLGDYHKHGRILDGGPLEQAEAAAARAWLADTLDGRQSLLIVDSNEQAARMCAQLRAELVRLGHVDQTHAVPLGLQGVWASRGDLVQARRNAWELAGYSGNRRGPINREQFRVIDTHEDGGLVVAPILGRGRDGEQYGDRITLPAGYVRDHVALGYASTVHAAQGVTVDTSHAVITQNTSAEALYVGMSRGRYRNIAHVVTRAVPNDAPTGAVKEAVHKSPQAVLAGVFDTDDPQLSALAEANQSAAETESVRTPAELFADAAQIATANRTAGWLDQLVADGALTEQQRAGLAAEDGATTLNTLLRRVEIAGHDPKQVLTDAVHERSLDDARQISNVLHSRITTSTSLEPAGDRFTDWIPTVDDPQWRAYLTTLAETADARRDELGRQAAEHAPQWAVEALGPVPQDQDERDVWEGRAGTAAAHRELVGHDSPDDALGPAPKAGQVEAHASWQAAWRALGRPEAERAEAEMSTGQLRVRIRAYDREKTWAPAYVANELAATRQATDKHRQDAALRRAEAGGDPQRPDLDLEADQGSALAEALDARAADLEQADEARAEWYAHTAETRAAADRAQAELSNRGAEHDRPEDMVTAELWLEAHDAAAKQDDDHREIRAEHELADIHEQREQDQNAVAPVVLEGAPEEAPPDIRQETQDTRPDDDQRDEVRVPNADETAASVERARRALRELKQRQAAEEQHARDEARAYELANWRADQHSGARVGAQSKQEADADKDTPVLELAPLDD